MAISGIVLTAHDPNAASSLVHQLAHGPGIEIGEQRGRRVALVLEVEDGLDEEVIDRLRLLPGVVDVAIAAIHFPADEFDQV